MQKQTKQFLAVGAGVVALAWLLRRKAQTQEPQFTLEGVTFAQSQAPADFVRLSDNNAGIYGIISARGTVRNSGDVAGTVRVRILMLGPSASLGTLSSSVSNVPSATSYLDFALSPGASTPFDLAGAVPDANVPTTGAGVGFWRAMVRLTPPNESTIYADAQAPANLVQVRAGPAGSLAGNPTFVVSARARIL